MAANWISNQIHDIDLLLRSGVLKQSNAIVLSRPGPDSQEEDLGFFVRDLFTRLQIGGIEFKKKAMESLLELLDNDEVSSNLVAEEGNVGYLIHLLDLSAHPSLREQAVSVISILAASSSDKARKCVFEEGALGPLLRIIESSSLAFKEKAVMAVESITADPDNAWAISAYGGVSVLIDVCKSGSVVAQSHAIGAITNMASIEEIRICLVEDGAVSVIVQLLSSGQEKAQEKAAQCVSILASSGDDFRDLILKERGLQKLLCLLHDSSNSSTLEHVLRAIYSLSALDSTAQLLSTCSSFVIQLSELIKHGSLVLQQLSVSLLANLSSMNEGTKRAIGGCMGSLVKLMELIKPVGIQEKATQALLLLLTVKSNRKYFVRDEKSVMRLVQMLDPKNEMVSKKFPVAVVAAIMAGGSQGCRKRLLDAGAYVNLQRLTEMEVAGAKKALQKFSGNRLKTIFTRTWRELTEK